MRTKMSWVPCKTVSIRTSWVSICDPSTNATLTSLGSQVVRDSSMSSAVGIMGVKFEKAATPRRIHLTYGHTTDSMVCSVLEVALAHLTYDRLWHIGMLP